MKTEYNKAAKYILTSYGILFIFEKYTGTENDSITIAVIDDSVYLIQGENKACLNDKIIDQLMNLINHNPEIKIVFAGNNNDIYEVTPEFILNLKPKDIVQFVSDYNAQKTYIKMTNSDHL